MTLTEHFLDNLNEVYELDDTSNEIEEQQRKSFGKPFVIRRSDGTYSLMWDAGFHSETVPGRHMAGVGEGEEGARILVGGTPEWNEELNSWVLPRKVVPISQLGLEAQSRAIEKSNFTSREVSDAVPEDPEALQKVIEQMRKNLRYKVGGAVLERYDPL